MAGDFAKALAYQDRLMPLHRALFLEPSPAGAKYALSLLGQDERGTAPAAGDGDRDRPGPRFARPWCMPA